MMEAIQGFVAELRRVGIPVRLSEVVDAHRTLAHLDLADREQLRTAFGAVLVKTSDHLATFNAIFDLYFAVARPDPAAGSESNTGDGEESAGAGHAAGDGGGGGGMLSDLDDQGIKALLLEALNQPENTLLRAVVQQLVDRHAGIQPGRAVAGTYYLFRTLRAVDPDSLLTKLVQARAPEDGTDGVAPTESDLDRRLRTDWAQGRIDELRREVEAEIRRRLVADRGAEAVAKTLRQPLPEDVSFLNASREQVVALRQILQPMTRKLASRLSIRRRSKSRGQLDVRRTIRGSMSSGGVPLEPVFRHPRPSKPELVVLADISGSVSSFAAFTLQLAFALRSEFAKVRCFVFVDGVDEVSALMADATDLTEVTRRINDGGLGVWMDGRSDYGNALESFWERHGSELRRRSTVLVLGDARTNYHASGAHVLKSIRRQAGRLYWLNPEPVAAWNSGDSVMKEYAPHCHRVVECRNVRQLRGFIEQLE